MLFTRSTTSSLLRSVTLQGGTHHPLTLRSFQSKTRQRGGRMRTVAKRRKPDIQQAMALPLSFQEMCNTSLAILGASENYKARREILIRHIMCKDKVTYDSALETYETIREKNRENMYLLSLPYHVGIGAAVAAGFFSLPMVFHLPTAEWFNTHYVTTDVPEPQDLETMMEIGSWTWNWMEPPLGTISFFLLTLQFSRAQIHNLGIKPYTAKIKDWRANRLAKAFPEYDRTVLRNYSKSATLHK